MSPWECPLVRDFRDSRHHPTHQDILVSGVEFDGKLRWRLLDALAPDLVAPGREVNQQFALVPVLDGNRDRDAPAEARGTGGRCYLGRVGMLRGYHRLPVWGGK